MTESEPDGEIPVMFSFAGDACNHLYHWDDADNLYRCVYCDSTQQEGPFE